MTAPALAPSPELQPKRKNPIGLASMIVGLVGLVVAFAPVLSFVAWFPGLVGIGLAIAGMVLANRRRLTSVLGLVFGVLAVVASLVVSVVSIAALATALTGVTGGSEAESGPPVTLVYEVTSDAPTAGNISYSSFDTNNSANLQEANAALPWSVTQEVSRGSGFDFNTYTLLAQSSDAATVISCTITLDGQVISEETASGAHSVAACSASSSDLAD